MFILYAHAGLLGGVDTGQTLQQPLMTHTVQTQPPGTGLNAQPRTAVRHFDDDGVSEHLYEVSRPAVQPLQNIDTFFSQCGIRLNSPQQAACEHVYLASCPAAALACMA